jgi:hypothetical protein
MLAKLGSIIRCCQPLPRRATHTDERVLEAYAMGAVAPETLAELEEHLLSCGACRTRLEQQESFVHLFREAAADLRIRPERAYQHRWNYRLAAWALTPIAACLLFFMMAPSPHLSSVPPPAVILHPLRGAEAPIRIKPGTDFLLVLDAPLADASQPYQIQFVDREGREIHRTAVVARNDRLTLRCAGLSRGVYWVRVYGSSPDPAPLIEYRLQVE